MEQEDPDITEDEIEEQEDPIDITIKSLSQRVGFLLRFTMNHNLLGSIVKVSRGRNKGSPLQVLVEYPYRSSIVWMTITGAARQAYLDRCFLRKKIPKFFTGQDGVSGNPNQWEYLTADSTWRNLNDCLLTQRVRNGEIPVTDDPSLLPLVGEKPIPSPNLPRYSLLNTVDHLL
jgi:hypothetical protein